MNIYEFQRRIKTIIPENTAMQDNSNNDLLRELIDRFDSVFKLVDHKGSMNIEKSRIILHKFV